MYRSALFSFIACAVMASYVHGNPGGAPAAACDTMTPGHGVSAQSGSSTYTIGLSSSTYKCGESVTVTLGGSSSFKGFLCQARMNADTASSRVGTMDITGVSNIQRSCNNQAVTHTSRDEKTSMTFKWTPSGNHSNVYIVCTWVQQQVTFWVREPSTMLTYQAGGDCGNGVSHVTSGLLMTVLSTLTYIFLF